MSVPNRIFAVIWGYKDNKKGVYLHMNGCIFD